MEAIFNGLSEIFFGNFFTQKTLGDRLSEISNKFGWEDFTWTVPTK
jgi:hypothetical protein